MHSRREIRETTIQFLYCMDLEGAASPEDLIDTFWDLALESDNLKLTKATIKSLLHLNQGRSGRYTKLIDRSPEALALISANPDAEKLKTLLKQILKQEEKWQPLVDRINRLYKPSNDEIPSDLQDTIKELFTLNRSLIALRKDYNLLLQDFPLINKQLEGITATINAIQRVSDRTSMVENPAASPDNAEIKHLRETAAHIESFRNEVNDLASAVLKHKAELDNKIETTVENFKPERIDPIDRATLRLGLYEIFHREDVPTAVAINEAIEISKRFGSQDSPKFINGILDKIAKSED